MTIEGENKETTSERESISVDKTSLPVRTNVPPNPSLETKVALPEVPSPDLMIVRQSQGSKGIDERNDKQQSGYQEAELR